MNIKLLRAEGAYLALLVCLRLLALLAEIGRAHARTSGAPSWHDRLPVVGLEGLDTASREGRRLMRIIGYERVATARHGASGLGIEAQRQVIETYVEQRSATLIARFTEVESRRWPDRLELGEGAAPGQGDGCYAGP